MRTLVAGEKGALKNYRGFAKNQRFVVNQIRLHFEEIACKIYLNIKIDKTSTCLKIFIPA